MPKLHLIYTVTIFLAAGAAHAAGTAQSTPGSAAGATTTPPNTVTTQITPNTITPGRSATPSERPMNPWDMSTWKLQGGEPFSQPPGPKTSGAR